MKGYVGDIEKQAQENENVRTVIFTGNTSQLVLMSLVPGEDIGEEVHDNVDQFFRFEKGEGKVIIDGKETKIKDDWAVVVPAGSNHNIVNTSKTEKLKLYTIYSPSNHPNGTVHKTRKEAMAAEDH